MSCGGGVLRLTLCFKMAEAKITRDVKDLLKFYKKNFKPHIFFWKVSDRFTSGIPDFYVLIAGTPVHIELKDKGKKPSNIQKHVISSIKLAGGHALISDCFFEVKGFIELILKEKGLK